MTEPKAVNKVFKKLRHGELFEDIDGLWIRIYEIVDQSNTAWNSICVASLDEDVVAGSRANYNIHTQVSSLGMYQTEMGVDMSIKFQSKVHDGTYINTGDIVEVGGRSYMAMPDTGGCTNCAFMNSPGCGYKELKTCYSIFKELDPIEALIKQVEELDDSNNEDS
jgi:hypothetical protein